MRKLFFAFILLFGIHCTGQELVGPGHIATGTLALFELIPPQEASWHIVAPSANVESHQVDTSTSKLYFANPERGHYTVIAGIVVNGKSQLLVKTFINSDVDDKPTPIPKPPVTPLETWIKTQTPILVKSKNIVTESQLVAGCFEQVVKRIDEQNIKTSQNARTQLQVALTATLAQASSTAVLDWMPFISELSRRLEQELGDAINDLTEIKKMVQSVGNAMRSLELPKNIPLQGIDTPNNRSSQNRAFRNLLSN